MKKRASLVGLLLAAASAFNWTAIPAFTDQSPTHGPVLAFSTYFGRGLVPFLNGIAVDSAGNTYVAGSTNSTDLPTTPGAFQTSYAGKDAANGGDVFVAKFSPDGTLIYSTYLGGSDSEQAFGIAVDNAGCAYVTGLTSGKDFPTTPGAFRTTFASFRTVFLSKLNAAGTELVYSTFLESGVYFSPGFPRAIAVDSSGNAYVTGESTASVYATGALQIGPGGGDFDAFVMKVNPTGTGIGYYAYLGGNGKDQGNGITVDSSGNAYVTGNTTSTNFPTTSNAFKARHREPLIAEPFVAKLNSSGTALMYSTLLGGSGVVSGIAVDSSGQAYVAGGTSSTDFPTTPGAFQRIYGGGQSDAFITKLNGDGSSLVYSTYIGGGAQDDCAGISIDDSGNAYIVGSTTSNSLPVTNALQPTNATGLAFKSDDAANTWAVAQNRLAADAVRSLVVDPATTFTIYAATDEGVFKTTDSGGTWRTANEGLTTFDIRVLTIDSKNSSVLYAVGFDEPYDESGGVLKSTDGGGSWRATSQSAGVYSVSVDPLNPSIIYAAGRSAKGGGVYKSTDGGETWGFTLVTVVPQNPGSVVDFLEIDPNVPSNLYAAVGLRFCVVCIEGERDTIIKSTDAGGSWSITPLSAVNVRSIKVDPQNSSTLYVATYQGGIFKSVDGGSKWIPVNDGLTSLGVLSLTIDPAHPSTLYAGSYGLFKSTNGGGSWGITGIEDAPVTSVAIDPKNTSTLYATTSLSRDAFVAKLNASGSALDYSTYFGGRDEEFGYGIAVDRSGAASITGTTGSPDLPTAGSLQPPRSIYWNIFVTRLGPSQGVAAPKVVDAAVSGKKLIVFGENFSDSAVIVLNSEAQKTSNEPGSPTAALIGKKSGKRIGRGQRVIIQVRNSDGALSEAFNFIRPID